MPSNFLSSINIMMAPFIGLILIFFDNWRNRYTDMIYRKVLTYQIIFTLGAMLSELAYESLKGGPGAGINIICGALNTLYFIFQISAFSLMVLFLDYSTHLDEVRLKKLSYIVIGICTLNLGMLVINWFTGIIFIITSDNLYQRGDLYIIRLCLAHVLMILIICNLVLSRKRINRNLFKLIVISAFPACVGSTLDLLVTGARTIWPCFFVSMLFGYLFIVRTNTMLDSLTGIYNRRGCDEFLLELLKTPRKQEYAFIMIDMDRFKEINDTYGHKQGDIALRDTAGVLRSCMRRTDFVARYGGDEFFIVATTNEPEKIIEKIMQGIEALNMREKQPYTLSMSCGSGVYSPSDIRTPYEFLDYVDGVMYSKKIECRRAGIGIKTYTSEHPVCEEIGNA